MTELKLQSPDKDIINYFEGLEIKVFTRSDIDKILSENRERWRISISTTVLSFIAFLLEKADLKSHKFEFPDRNILRYAWGNASTYELVASIKPKSYFTHYTAMYFHELTEQIPNVIFINFEQERKYSPDGDLDQSNIDTAFKRPVRTSNNFAMHKNYKICLLNGMGTDNLGVIFLKHREGGSIPITNIERTLIDIAVRPVYSGGVFEVLKAYRMAKGKVSINKLVSYLKKIGYVYPYHQVVGFYLEKSGAYSESSIRLLRKFEMKNDFYLVHNMKNVEYSKRWRLFIPKGF